MMDETGTPASLEDFPWQGAAEARPEENPGDFAGELSEQFRRLWAHNTRLREPLEAADFLGRDGKGSDSERAWHFAYWAGRCGADKADTARRLVGFYSRPGAKGAAKATRTMAGTLRAWAQGREDAEREAGGNGHHAPGASEVLGPEPSGPATAPANESGPSLPALDAPVTVLRAARNAGMPIPTGLAVLDDRMRGGLRLGKAVALGGTAGVGKTAFLLQIGMASAAAGCAVGGLMADEGRETAVIRVGQQRGYPREALEAGQEAALDALERELSPYILRFPDPDGETDATLEGVSEALARAYPNHPKVLLVDSLQTVRTRRGAQEFRSLRERIMDNARTARRLAVEHHLAVIYTSEVNRGWYRARKEEDRSSDLAAFAEARIEFSADVLLLLRASEEDPDLVEIRIPKNRLGDRRPFLVRLDRARASFTMVEGDPRQGLQEAAESQRVEGVKGAICRELQAHPRVTRAQLRELVGGRGVVFSAALGDLRAAGLVVTETEGRRVLHSLAEAPKA